MNLFISAGNIVLILLVTLSALLTLRPAAVKVLDCLRRRLHSRRTRPLV